MLEGIILYQEAGNNKMLDSYTAQKILPQVFPFYDYGTKKL